MAFVWEQRKLGEVAKYRNGKAHENCIDDDGKYIVVNSKFVSTNGKVKKFSNMQNEPLFENEVAFVLSDVPNGRAIARTFLVEKSDKYTLNQRIAGITPLNETDPYYLHVLMNRHPYFLAFDDGVKQTNLSVSDVMKFESYYPKYEEQETIGRCFSQLDQLITLHQRKRMLRRCFFSIDWEQRKLGDLVERITKKNQDLLSELPLTISAQYGLIDQKEFFDKRVASKDISGYYLIKNGEFAYNKSTSTDAPWGAIKRLDRYETGVLSTLYIVFGIKKDTELNSNFLTAYYSTNLWHKEIHEIAAEGARNHGLLNISPADFFKTKLSTPQDLKEQNKIGNYFIQLDQLITLHQCKSNFCKKNEVNAWEQRKVSEIADRFDNLRVPVAANLRTPGTTPYYGANGIQDYVEGYTHDGEFVLVAEDGANDLKNYPVKCVNGRIWVNNHAHVLQARPQIASNQFLAYSMSQANIEALLVGGGRAKLNAEVMMGIVLRIPRLQEQEVIGGYFYKLDQLITLHQWECNINENTEGNDEKQRKPIKKLIISEGNLSLVDDMFLLHRMTFLVCNKYILLRLNVVKYKITIIIISNILYSIVSLLIIACYLIVINKQLIILIYVEISVVIIKGDDDYARIRS
ncbi:restriction endonuclease subunit S [[Clostridium] innocuum]|uniref:restriction endonuclease subunit S n=1 Tax=Clostridium innocuum TaxID=1522 RepID=UPI00321934E2